MKPATIDDYMRLADVMAQRLAEYLYDHEDGKGKEAGDVYTAAREELKGALISGVLEEPDCPACHGAGEREVFRGDLGPDSYSELMTCPDCGGTGNAAAPADEPHHCAPKDIDSLLRWLDAINDPQQEAVPSWQNTDWRGKAGVIAKVIRYLRSSPPSPLGDTPDQQEQKR